MSIELTKDARKQAVLEVQERLQTRIMEIDIEVHEDEFQYWREHDRRKHRK